MDNVSKRKRSDTMSRIKSQDSKIEIKFRKQLWAAGFRYRKNSLKYLGKPDLVLSMCKTVIFIDSCFWHGCKKHCRMPSSRVEYWNKKIESNKLRDKKVNRHYKKIGWKVVRIWEHDLKKKDYEFDFNRILG